MTDIKKNLNNIFKKSRVFSESKTTELNEKFWDEIKGEWVKGKEIGKDPVKNLAKSLRDKIGDRIFNKKDDKQRVAGTGSASKIVKPNATAPVVTPVVTPAASAPAETSATAQAAAPAKPTPAPATPATAAAAPATTDPVSTNQPDLIPKNAKGSVATLNPVGIELQGIEDPNQKERKIIQPIKTLLKGKNKDFLNEFDKIKAKNGIASKNSTDEISAMDADDPVRKTIIRNLFAVKFYHNAYFSVLENLRKLNIISEDKIDAGVFQQAIWNAIEKAKQKHARRYAASFKKINNLHKNEKDANFGLRKGETAFRRDLNDLYKSNKDKFTMLNMQESIAFDQFFNERLIEAIDEPEDTQKEDETIRANDYVWWLDVDELEKVMNNDKLRKRLTYKNTPIEFEVVSNGKFVDGSAAQVKYLDGPKKGESEKIDIRNIDIPQDIAVTLVNFGKVLNKTSDIDDEIAKRKNILNDPSSSVDEQIRAKTELEVFEKKKAKKEEVGSVAKVQKFLPKDINNLAKTISGGKTKITPDPSGKTYEVESKDLVKLNKKGKATLLKIIGVASIALHSLLSVLSGKSIQDFLGGINNFFGKPAEIFGGMAGSKNQTNF